MATRRVVFNACLASLVVNGWGSAASCRIASAGVFGSTMDEARTKKAEVIAYALDTLAITDPARVVMVGDRLHDVAGAKENGLACIGVLYGYGSRQELEDAGADAIAADLGELAALLV